MNETSTPRRSARPESTGNDCAAPARGGFALVVALSLMAFVFLLMLSISTLLKVEFRTSGTQKSMLMARQNAQIGLFEALGRLQALAGPDQRITGTSAILDTNPQTESIEGVEQPYLTGIWKSYKPPEPTELNFNYPHGAANPTWGREVAVDKQARFLGWLVSSNNGAAGAYAFAQAPAPTDAVKLLGEGTLGTSTDAGMHIYADRVELENGDTGTVGHYAYWVADEGVKAKLNVVDAEVMNDTADDNDFRGRDNLSAVPSTGVEVLDGMDQFDRRDSDQMAVLERLSTAKELDFLGDGVGEAYAGFYHDLSLHSMGVQVDVRNGGLKKDLSLAFEMPDSGFNQTPYGNPGRQPYSSSNPDSTPGYFNGNNHSLDGGAFRVQTIQDNSTYGNGGTDYVTTINWQYGREYQGEQKDQTRTLPLSGGAPAYLKGPTWHLIRSFYRMYKQVSNPAGAPWIRGRSYYPNMYNASQNPNTMTYFYRSLYPHWSWGDVEHQNFGTESDMVWGWQRKTRMDVAPVLNRFMLFYSLTVLDVVDNNGVTHEDVLGLVLTPVIVLHNPYNVTLRFSGARVSLQNIPIRAQFSVQWPDVDSNGEPIVNPDGTFDWGDEYYYPGKAGDNLQEESDADESSRNKRGVPIEALARDGKSNFSRGYPPITVFLTKDGSVSGPGDDIVFEPGELKVFSVPAIGNQPQSFSRKLVAHEGYHPLGGTIFTKLNYSDYNNRADQDGLDNDDNGVVDDESPYIQVHVDRDGIGADTSCLTQLQVLAGPGQASIGRQWYFEEQLWLWYMIPPAYRIDDMIADTSTSRYEAYEYAQSLYDFRFGNNYDLTSKNHVVPGLIDVSPTYSSSILTGNIVPMGVTDVLLKPGDYNNQSTAVYYETEPFSYNYRANVSGWNRANGSESKLLPLIHYISARSVNDFSDGLSVIGDNALWGQSNSNAGGDTRVVMYEVPTQPILSLGSLQHVPVSMNHWAPNYAIGNSFPSRYFDEQRLLGFTYYQGAQDGWPANDLNPYVQFDMSYMLNDQFWDGYFFSSLAPEVKSHAQAPAWSWSGSGLGGDFYQKSLADLEYDGSQYDAAPDEVLDEVLDGSGALENRRMKLYRSENFTDGDIKGRIFPNASNDWGYDKIAAHLLTDGSFNVNSTSVDAWYAFLAGLSDLDISTVAGGNVASSSVRDVALSRFTLPGDDDRNAWSGFRSVSESDIRRLAEEIVVQVKQRGPFLNMAEFINRNPFSNVASDRKGGALQVALDNARINNSVINSEGSSYSVPSGSGNPNGVRGNTAAGIPGDISQADLLTPTAPFLSVRSDTFVIRSYGDVVNPVTGEVESRVWCEAVVQRVPDYVDSDTSAGGDLPEAREPGLSAVNQSFGRRFKIVGFRWLDDDEV